MDKFTEYPERQSKTVMVRGAQRAVESRPDDQLLPPIDHKLPLIDIQPVPEDPVVHHA